MSCNEVDLLQWESLVSGVEASDCSVRVCSSVVDSVVTTANDPPSDLPSVVCSSVESSEVL